MSVVDLLGRPLRSLRVSVTDRCNLRCQYCMPEAEYTWLPREDLLTFEEIRTLVRVFAGLGVDKVRLTGGEPLLRRNLHELVGLLAADGLLTDLALTTNGVLLAEQAQALRDAGLAAPHRQPRHPAPRSLHGADAPDDARQGRRGPGARGPDLRRAQDRHGRDARRQRRRDRAAGRVRDASRRRGALHRVHGRRRRHAVGRREGGGHAPRSSSASPRTTAESTPIDESAWAPADRFRLPDGRVVGVIASTTEPVLLDVRPQRA